MPQGWNLVANCKIATDSQKMNGPKLFECQIAFWVRIRTLPKTALNFQTVHTPKFKVEGGNLDFGFWVLHKIITTTHRVGIVCCN